MAIDNKMNAKQFGLWIEEQVGAQYRRGPGWTHCVINIDHIEPGRFAALYIVDSRNGLLVMELADIFTSEAAAWQALQNESSPVHPPKPCDEWIKEQYLTDRNARVERLNILSVLL